jgi:molecular chaperone GrpE (heat shock protein)
LGNRRHPDVEPTRGAGASPKGAEIAQQAIDEARRIGLKTDRERDYVDAVAAYYQDFGTRSERERQVARAQAYEALAKKYPVDDEAQIFARCTSQAPRRNRTRRTLPT